MTRISALTSRYDRFLRTPLFETNGVPLNLLSVLTRLEIDPWEEAARLASLSTDQAANSLASTIWKAGSDRLSAADASILAVQLIKLLPRDADSVSTYPALTNHGGQFLMWLVYGIIWGSLILTGANTEQSNRGDAVEPQNLTVAAQTIAPAGAIIPAAKADRR